MKKFIVCLLVCLLMVNSIVFANVSGEITVMVDENKVEFDQKPVIENGRTLVPVRAIFEALNAKVTWDEEIQTVTARKMTNYKVDITVKLQIGSKEMSVSRDFGEDKDKKVMLDVPAKLINGRTMVPVRAISEAFECDVQWIPTSSTVVVTPYMAGYESVIVCYDGYNTQTLVSVSVEDNNGRIMKDAVYSVETGNFEQMIKYQYYGNVREVSVFYADGTTDSYSEEYIEE